MAGTPEARPISDSSNDRAASREHAIIAELLKKPLGARLLGYTRLAGPGWLQSAITLGGGSLASSLYLGVLAGFSLLWLQPLAMILGIVMLSAIGYVSLSTGERPFRAINRHINPVLGWGWAVATALANMVWCLPQFSLGTAAVRQNLLPRLVGDDVMGEFWGKLIVAGAILIISIIVIWLYDTGKRGIRIFEGLLKAMVGVIILCFFGVVIKMGAEGVLDWRGIFGGLVPDLSLLTQPAATFNAALAATGEYAAFWKDMIVDMQRDVMISAAATAVGINMTFLLPYSMLAKGWNRNFRGVAVFDLSTGLFVPFILATGCIIIASSTQFHAKYDPSLVGGGAYVQIVDGRLKKEMGAEAFGRLSEKECGARRDALPEGEKRMAAMLVKRDAFSLANSLKPLTGPVFSQYVFGIGVVCMALSSVIILMLISGFVICEMLDIPPEGKAHRWACMLPAVGVLGPFIWTGKAQFWLAVPTSIFCMVLAPIAYWTFFFMMNSRNLLGDALPRGGKRVAWNVLMLVAVAFITFGCLWSIWSSKARWWGLAGLAAFLGLAVVVHFARPRRPSSGESACSGES
ncbi:MAG TPA: divalent metal cation transporter [Sumerlaeia bacterium]|nr:divalent metal cation transporter [Sumerlaeia bacterium]